jgi:hypothetical protein
MVGILRKHELSEPALMLQNVVEQNSTNVRHHFHGLSDLKAVMEIQ